MIKTFEGKVTNEGQVRLTEPANLPGGAKVFVSVVEDEDQIGGIPVTVLLSERSLADWDTPEEDEAWKHLQPDKS